MDRFLERSYWYRKWGKIVVISGKVVVRNTVPVCPTIAKPPDRTLRKFSSAAQSRLLAIVEDSSHSGKKEHTVAIHDLKDGVSATGSPYRLPSEVPLRSPLEWA